MQKKVPTGLSLPKELKQKIDLERGDISRSRFLLRILEKHYGQQRKGGEGYSIDCQAKQEGLEAGRGGCVVVGEAYHH